MNLNIKIIAALAVCIIAVLFASSMIPFGTEPTATGKMHSLPANFNIRNYSHVVSSEKPTEAILSFAEEASTEEKTATELTIYNQDLALVKEVRDLYLKEGLNLVKYKDIASQIDSTSVFFNDLTFPDTFVVEQNYEYDLVSLNKLLERYLDEEITVRVKEGQASKTYSGTLLSSSGGGVLLQTGKEVVSLNGVESVSFPELPEGLLTKPTLVWKLYTENAGDRETQTVYLTGGLSWRADYIAKINENDTKMDFKGWVTTTNTSGTSYPNTKLKLVAGDVHRVTGKGVPAPSSYAYETMDAGYAPKQFTEETLFEYHLYSLERSTDIANNETKQISLLSSESVPVKKEFVFDGAYYGTKVRVMLEFNNAEDQGMGMPLPKGIVRVYKPDSDGQLQFLGEDNIDHTPKDEKARIFVGNAFDVVGERTETSSTKISNRTWRNSFEVKLRNHKEEDVEVVIVEHPGTNWKMVETSDDFTQKDARTIEFIVSVPKDGEKIITYTVEYRY